jgi:hypothetical protein
MYASRGKHGVVHGKSRCADAAQKEYHRYDSFIQSRPRLFPIIVMMLQAA